jgi:peptide/nickel transport system substrate-binding protein
VNTQKIEETLKKEWSIGFLERIMNVVRSFSLTEKTIFIIVSIIFIFSGLSLLYKVNNSFLVEIPDYGGSLTEGIVGAPRFINPLLASSDVDRDLTTLVYSGLLKVNSQGELIPDIAESYSISDDGLIYTFKLKENIFFHDGDKLTADDVVFTIKKAQDPLLKSPREANWIGVTVEKIDDFTVVFNLRQAYSAFIQNTTLGILPEHIWKDVSIEEFPFSKWNTDPTGTGPYKVDTVLNTDSGLPKEYKLSAFNKYALGKPYISHINIKTYQNEKDIIDAYKNGDIESLHGISPKQLPTLNPEKDEVVLSTLPRVFGVFFNQNIAGVFVYKEVRQALNVSANKQAIVNEILGGYGMVIDSPIPKKDATAVSTTSTTIMDVENMEKAKEILTKAGWKQNASGIFEKKDKTSTVRLAFSISTGNAPELKEAAMLLQKQWQMIGADVEVKVFEISDLNQDVIKTRKYDALLFGTIVGRDMDFYPFWHSSNRNSPGLNIAMYTNSKVDKILENIRKSTDPIEQKTYLDNFEKEIKNDIPAVFTHSPYFIYIVPTKVKNVELGLLVTSAERFAQVSEWYIETSKVWEIFNRNNN